MKTCLYRFLGNCKNCKEDYDPRHKPNNYDCPRYHEIQILTFEVKKSLEKKVEVREL